MDVVRGLACTMIALSVVGAVLLAAVPCVGATVAVEGDPASGWRLMRDGEPFPMRPGVA
jgi:hypothetical protein